MTGGGGEGSVDEVFLPSHYAFHMYSKPPPPVVYCNVFTSWRRARMKRSVLKSLGLLE